MAYSWHMGSLPSRRLYSRVQTSSVWVYWNCDRKADVSPVRDMGVGGLFLKTPQLKLVGSVVNLHFLVQEGQIRADAVVKYVKPGDGVGMKFAAVSQQDRSRLVALMTRLRGLARRNVSVPQKGN